MATRPASMFDWAAELRDNSSRRNVMTFRQSQAVSGQIPMGDLSPRLDPLLKLQESTALSKLQGLLQPNTWRRRFVCFSIVTGSRLTHVRPWPKLCEATLLQSGYGYMKEFCSKMSLFPPDRVLFLFREEVLRSESIYLGARLLTNI